MVLMDIYLFLWCFFMIKNYYKLSKMGIHGNLWYFFYLKPTGFVLERCKQYYSMLCQKKSLWNLVIRSVFSSMWGHCLGVLRILWVLWWRRLNFWSITCHGQIFLYSPSKYLETLNWNLQGFSWCFWEQFERIICEKRKYEKLPV